MVCPTSPYPLFTLFMLCVSACHRFLLMNVHVRVVLIIMHFMISTFSVLTLSSPKFRSEENISSLHDAIIYARCRRTLITMDNWKHSVFLWFVWIEHVIITAWMDPVKVIWGSNKTSLKVTVSIHTPSHHFIVLYLDYFGISFFISHFGSNLFGILFSFSSSFYVWMFWLIVFSFFDVLEALKYPHHYCMITE